MTHFIRMFRPEFADKIRSGQKLQTVRPVPKRRPAPGDTLSLRMWADRPYASKQIELAESKVTKVEDIVITELGYIVINGNMLSGADANAFARADGFPGMNEFIGFFETVHDLPFEGIVIHWEKP
jgi:hypothetical protein